MYLIPQLKTKKSKDKWLQTKLKYDNSTYQDICNDICYFIINWCNKQRDISMIIDEDKLMNEIIHIFYHGTYTLKQLREDRIYYELKYNEEIYDLYQIISQYEIDCEDLLKNINHMDLFNFIYDNSQLIDEDEDINENDDYYSD